MSTEQDPAPVMRALHESVRSLHLATLGEQGEPHTGYTPFALHGRDFLVFVSQLSLHTRDLLRDPRVSVMLIEDEQAAARLFARTRVSYQCQAEAIAPGSPDYEPLLDHVQATQGSMLKLLRQLPDFVLFRLRPHSGQFVMGFGAAFKLVGENLDQFEHARSA